MGWFGACAIGRIRRFIATYVPGFSRKIGLVRSSRPANSARGMTDVGRNSESVLRQTSETPSVWSDRQPTRRNTPSAIAPYASSILQMRHDLRGEQLHVPLGQLIVEHR